MGKVINKSVVRGSGIPNYSNAYWSISMIIYLYKKTHNTTGLKYLGKTTAKNPHKYKGSGHYWKHHIKKHGYDVTTEILKECETKEEFIKWGKYYSELWDVVNSDEWANLKPEEGDGGTGCPGYKHTPEMLEYLSHISKGVPKSESHKASMSRARMGFKWGNHTEESKIRIRNQSHTEEYIQFLKTSRVGNGNPSADKTVYTFKNDNGVTETCTRSDLRIKYKLTKSHMRTIIVYHGKSNGWRLMTAS